MVLDATGHARKLVKFDKKFDPGFQGAYGIIAEVESHPFDLKTMLFMDWRDEHTFHDPAMRAANTKLPTFLYAMPFSPTRVFLEETALVSRPAISFPELKARLEARLKWLGIKVRCVHVWLVTSLDTLALACLCMHHSPPHESTCLHAYHTHVLHAHIPTTRVTCMHACTHVEKACTHAYHTATCMHTYLPHV
jgi:hypothetical protein